MLFKQITAKYADGHYPYYSAKKHQHRQKLGCLPQKFVTLDSILFHLVCYL
jgi:hypothetical protein